MLGLTLILERHGVEKRKVLGLESLTVVVGIPRGLIFTPTMGGDTKDEIRGVD